MTEGRFVELGRRLGRWAGYQLGLDLLRRSILARSIREEQAILEGRQLGLTDMDAREVIDTWREYLRWHPPGWEGSEDNYELIRRAMVARAVPTLDQPWEPPEWSQ